MRRSLLAFLAPAVLAACQTAVPALPTAPASDAPTPAGHIDVVLDQRFGGEGVLVTLDGRVLRSGALVQTEAPAWRARNAVSPDSHVVFIQVDGLNGRQFKSTRRILPSELRCVMARFDAAAAFPNNLRVETRPAC